MYSRDLPDGVYYIYAEYCAGPFYMGWWLYAAPIKTEQIPWYARSERGDFPDRESMVTLHEDWRLDALMKTLGLPVLRDYRGGNHTSCANAFLEKYPAGVLVQVAKSGRNFTVLPCDHLWDYSRIVREALLIGWKEAMKEPGGYYLIEQVTPIVEALRACVVQLQEYVEWHHKNAGGCSVEIESAYEQGRNILEQYDREQPDVKADEEVQN